MGKSIASSVPKLHEIARIVSPSHALKNPQQHKLRYSLKTRLSKKQASPTRVNSERVKMESLEKEGQNRVPLAQVVSECVKRWFQDTLKEAKAGDINMQVLVGQMYNSGYGVPKDPELGRAWINRASRSRSTAWKVSEKRPGYNVSDSDSDEPTNAR